MKKIAIALCLAEKATETQILEAIAKLKGKEVQQKPERELRKLGKDALERHTGLNLVHVAGDGQVFGNINDALTYAKTDKLKLVSVNREDDITAADDHETSNSTDTPPDNA